VVVSNPMKTRAIAEAKVKTDKVDAKAPISRSFPWAVKESNLQPWA